MPDPKDMSRYVYAGVYGLLYVLLVGLLLITPADIIEQSVKDKQYYNVWILAVVYFITTVIVCFVYLVRLYVVKVNLDAIPRDYIPIEREDVPKHVYKMIQAGLSRSAAIAYAARPRVWTEEERESRQHTRDGGNELPRMRRLSDGIAITLPTPEPVWGVIEHYGWSSPNAVELPNLQYETVIVEVPYLIEAKALTLAPPDPTSQTLPPMMDPEAAGLLQRKHYMSLRKYIIHLTSLDVLDINDNTLLFLKHYEYARFSTRPISNARFCELMDLFAKILRNMRPLNPSVLDSPAIAEESDIDNDAPAETNPSSQRSYSPRPSTASSQSSRSSRRRLRTRSSYLTAPNTPGGNRTMEFDAASQKTASFISVAQSIRSHRSSASLRSRFSDASGSVIRLATREDESALPRARAWVDWFWAYQKKEDV
ncbi:hypothetical protein PT974_02666 [Cladobotryum mycophilum]|uniref:Defect at low temperature protein 1 n=1 Tax=Cladobotryum mycophilum TaxID=491253 RepID=A0ABR0SZY7_9HYPO